MSDIDHAKELREWLDEAKHGPLTAPERRRAASHIKAMKSEIAALKADNAALVGAWPFALCGCTGDDSGTLGARLPDAACAVCSGTGAVPPPKGPHPGAALLERMKRLKDFAAYFAKMDCMGCKTNPNGYRGGLCTACGAREALKGGS